MTLKGDFRVCGSAPKHHITVMKKQNQSVSSLGSVIVPVIILPVRKQWMDSSAGVVGWCRICN